MPFFLIDRYYLLLVVPALLVTLWAQVRVKSTFAKYSHVFSRRGFTGKYAALYILRQNGVTGVSVSETGGHLSDHYDPRAGVIRLSGEV